MILPVRLAPETDGRWFAEIPLLPGVMAYGDTPTAAFVRAEALALRVLADRLEHGETEEVGFVFAPYDHHDQP